MWRTGLYNMIFLGSVGLSSFCLPPQVVRIFTHDPAVVPLAVACLRIVSCGNIGYAYAMVMLQAFNGAGDTMTPTIVNFFGFWLLEIPLAYWLAIRLGCETSGVYWSIVVAEGAIAVASVLLFRQREVEAADDLGWKRRLLGVRRGARLRMIGYGTGPAKPARTMGSGYWPAAEAAAWARRVTSSSFAAARA